ncbi:hypothetical protein [Sphingomonas corticis]|uniref:Carboxypeptidase regulatory-like domain-containing protein n=1 Tax=Sphingomonas corticis TaxID=2722791 RepID=A0ABX1CVL7_9SPHN|nr:hypothetical protein [Sphingomonas corticis]NJR80015.1 hypothetical protein [Sphingomonas corticis]
MIRTIVAVAMSTVACAVAAAAQLPFNAHSLRPDEEPVHYEIHGVAQEPEGVVVSLGARLANGYVIPIQVGPFHLEQRVRGEGGFRADAAAKAQALLLLTGTAQLVRPPDARGRR